MKKALLFFLITIIATFSLPAQSTTVQASEPLSVKIYPNPTTNKLTISYPKAIHLVNIEVYNIVGRLLQEILPQSTTNTQLSLEKLPVGMYLVKINGKNKTKTVRVKKYS